MSENPTTPSESRQQDTDQPTERPQEYVADVSFDELNLSPSVRRAVAERGYTHPTPVQAKAFGPVMQGRDLIVRSKTGTGKTAAFGLPLLEKIPESEKRVRALVLCPTRELALQVAAEIGDLGKYKGTRVSAIYGGASMKQQEDALEAGSPIVIGTPGRVYDHIRRGNLKLDACDHVVLDEADEMLNQGFYEEVTRILDCLPKGRQVLLFSATVPPEIQSLISRYTTNAESLLLSGDVLTVEHIHHIRYDISDAFPKPRNLIYVLEIEEPDNAIIFCNTRDDTALVTAVLNRNGFDAEVLNGDLPQKERERVMAKVKRGEVVFMVATDIAARGIDISDLGYVINYSLPEDPAVYLHRVGRTGRIGKKGVAINLVSGREISTLSVLEKKYTISFEKKQMPSPEEALKLWTDHHVREIRDASGSAVYEAFLSLAGQLKQRPDADDLIAFLLKYFFSRHRMEKAQALMAAQGEEPRPPREEAGGERRRERGERRERERDRGERRERRERRAEGGEEARAERAPRREPRARAEPAAGQVRLWINLGRGDKLDESSLGAALEGAGAPAGKLAQVNLRDGYSYLFAAEEDVPAFEALTGKQHGEKTLKVERARERDEGRREREREPRAPRAEPAPGQVRLWTNLGRGDAPDEAAFQAALEAAGAPAGKVAAVNLRDGFSHFFAAEEDVPAFEALTGKAHGAKILRIERAREEGAKREREREPRPPRVEAAPGQVRLWTNLGRSDAPDEAAFKAAVEAAGAPAGKVAQVSLRDGYSYLFVAEADVPAFEALTGKVHGAKTIKIERAREEGARREPREPRVEAAPGQARVWINLGKIDQLDEAGVKAALAAAGGPMDKVQNFELRDTHSYVFVAEADVGAFEALSGKLHGEKPLKIERARPSRPRR